MCFCGVAKYLEVLLLISRLQIFNLISKLYVIKHNAICFAKTCG